MTTDARRLTLDALDVQTDLFRYFARTDIGVSYMENIMREAIAAGEYAGDITAGVLTGSVFAVTSDIADLISSAATSLPSFDVQAYDMPARHGFVWLESPLVIPDRNGKTVVFRAFGWITSHFVTVTDENGPDPDEQVGDGVFFIGFSDPTDERDHLYDERLPLRMHTPHNLLPMISGIHSFDHPEWVESTDGLGVVRWFMAFSRFVGETWVDTRMIAPDRPTLKRAMRVTARVEEPSVHVVQLRRREQTHRVADDDAATQEWSHRWFVRGHWRNQWYPSMQAHRPKWIPEHIKGPDDKPLIVREKIFSVSR